MRKERRGNIYAKQLIVDVWICHIYVVYRTYMYYMVNGLDYPHTLTPSQL